MSDENKIQDGPCKTCETCFQFLTRPGKHPSGVPIAGLCDLQGVYIRDDEPACDAYVSRLPGSAFYVSERVIKNLHKLAENKE